MSETQVTRHWVEGLSRAEGCAVQAASGGHKPVLGMDREVSQPQSYYRAWGSAKKQHQLCHQGLPYQVPPLGDPVPHDSQSPSLSFSRFPAPRRGAELHS